MSEPRRWLTRVCVACVALLSWACGGDDDACFAGDGVAIGCGHDLCVGKLGVAGTRTIVIESGGRRRSFSLTVPNSALQGAPVPLVAVFHGVFADGAGIQERTGWPEKAAERGFITVAGDGVERSWNAGVCCEPATELDVDDVTFARDMVAAVEAEYCIDADRVFATGFSNGAAMVFRLLCDASDRFSAFAAVAGSLARFPCVPEQVRPVEIINNVDDPVVPFVLGELSFSESVRFNECGEGRLQEQPAVTAQCEIAADCAAGVHTSLCAVEGLSHQWPGDDSDPDGPFYATDYIWDFFARQ